jgi:ElaB/YqjD/DUF883 family membrane-anchored ribosome-binding protein
MSQSDEQVYTPKRDLHIGGLGPNSSGTLADHYLDAIEEEPGVWNTATDWIERARTALRDTDRFVRENPWQAMGIVAAVSFVGGLLFARRA